MKLLFGYTIILLNIVITYCEEVIACPPAFPDFEMSFKKTLGASTELAALVRTLKWKASAPPDCSFSYWLMSDLGKLNAERCTRNSNPLNMICSTTTSTTTTTTTTTTLPPPTTTPTLTTTTPTTTTTTTTTTASMTSSVASSGTSKSTIVHTMTTSRREQVNDTTQSDTPTSGHTPSSASDRPLLRTTARVASSKTKSAGHRTTYVIVGVAAGVMLIVSLVLLFCILSRSRRFGKNRKSACHRVNSCGSQVPVLSSQSSQGSSHTSGHSTPDKKRLGLIIEGIEVNHDNGGGQYDQSPRIWQSKIDDDIVNKVNQHHHHHHHEHHHEHQHPPPPPAALDHVDGKDNDAYVAETTFGPDTSQSSPETEYDHVTTDTGARSDGPSSSSGDVSSPGSRCSSDGGGISSFGAVPDVAIVSPPVVIDTSSAKNKAAIAKRVNTMQRNEFKQAADAYRNRILSLGADDEFDLDSSGLDLDTSAGGSFSTATIDDEVIRNWKRELATLTSDAKPDVLAGTLDVRPRPQRTPQPPPPVEYRNRPGLKKSDSRVSALAERFEHLSDVANR